MKHRHLHENVGLTMAAIDDILDHGKPEDWLELRRVIDAAPNGAVADRVLRLCKSHVIYGTSALWTAYIDKQRASRKDT